MGLPCMMLALSTRATLVVSFSACDPISVCDATQLKLPDPDIPTASSTELVSKPTSVDSIIHRAAQLFGERIKYTTLWRHSATPSRAPSPQGDSMFGTAEWHSRLSHSRSLCNTSGASHQHLACCCKSLIGALLFGATTRGHQKGIKRE
jgi:hypothetical protein